MDISTTNPSDIGVLCTNSAIGHHLESMNWLTKLTIPGPNQISELRSWRFCWGASNGYNANAEVEEIYHYLSGNGKSGHTEGLNNVKDYAQKKKRKLSKSRNFSKVVHLMFQSSVSRNETLKSIKTPSENGIHYFFFEDDLEGASCFDEIYNYIVI